ncbi:WYL domain-containing protein [Vibrio parahaemolyticus]|uniref:WYL domain-containing protein n=1 Tax=Vibrio parahaemolyticus TaxID=670 RepID=UPI00209BBFEE|nr:WYL domain-containing protein [Vibrio parahaemolyticus]MCR9645575.1 WYL domain-containing protein [Vibrio parahaemolyticus]MCR9798092.1 WYL domain-containing protein [Vibrio parahaemolyticus]MDF4966152.1 WYL domain-containing protein [Vibrio parahaemolyticus]MDF5063025.1 WYL domain-containing protein [Vibrio parahaemolyticus]MDF5232052.1 WYL domain-containing protein [Vibrio parahaemolyticus]
MIDLTYNGKTFESVHPYRLVNDRGIWFLAATYCDQLHSYRLPNISRIHRREDKYKPNQKVHEEIHTNRIKRSTRRYINKGWSG